MRPITLCRACGHQVGCDHCDARMVEHRFLKRLVCHQCGATKPIPTACPTCKVEGRMAPVGPGVERLAEEVAARFPEARLAVLSSDLFGSARALKDQIAHIAEGGADIIIGTQIVAKGHNFPLLTLVGVIDADLGLQGSDLRAAERTFQLMRQVAGRAGRADKPGDGAVADLPARPPGDPRHPGRRRGGLLARRGGRASRCRGAALWPHGRHHPSAAQMSRKSLISAPNLPAAIDPLLRDRRPGLRPRPGPHRPRPRPPPGAPADQGREIGAPLQAALAEWLAQFKLPTNLRLISRYRPAKLLLIASDRTAHPTRQIGLMEQVQ